MFTVSSHCQDHLGIQFLTAGTDRLILDDVPHLVVPVKHRHWTATKNKERKDWLPNIKMIIKYRSFSFGFSFWVSLKKGIICSPVISDGIVEVSFVLCTHWIEVSGQSLRLALVSNLQHPSSVAPHVHFHVWNRLDVDLQINNVSLPADAEGWLDRTNSNTASLH